MRNHCIHALIKFNLKKVHGIVLCQQTDTKIGLSTEMRNHCILIKFNLEKAHEIVLSLKANKLILKKKKKKKKILQFDCPLKFMKNHCIHVLIKFNLMKAHETVLSLNFSQQIDKLQLDCTLKRRKTLHTVFNLISALPSACLIVLMLYIPVNNFSAGIFSTFLGRGPRAFCFGKFSAF